MIDSIRKTPSAHCAPGVGDFMQSLYQSNIIVLPSFNSDSWRRCTLKRLRWCVERKVGELVQPWGASGDCLEVCFVRLVVGGNYAHCLVVVVVYMRFWRTKRRESFKDTIWGGNASHMEGQLLWERRDLIM